MKRDKFLTIRLTEEELLLIKQVAQQESRSISAQSLRFIMKSIANYWKENI